MTTSFWESWYKVMAMRIRQGAGTGVQGAAVATAKRKTRPIVYPESDGKPMAETGRHMMEMFRLIMTLRRFYDDVPLVHVSGNQLLYYIEGNPKACVAPDLYVVKGLPKLPLLDTYKLWEIGVPPALVLEATSKTTSREDRTKKWEIYARIGVQEYILYDPRIRGWETRYPPLQGFRLGPDGYAPIPADPEGALLSEELGLRLILEQGRLIFRDPHSGMRLYSPDELAEIERQRAEIERQRADDEHRRAEQEADARRSAEDRIAELERLLRGRLPPSP